MALDQMTHGFEIKLGTVEGGRVSIKGFVEFNTDGSVSFEISDMSKPITPEAMKDFNEVMDLMKRLHDTHGGILKIEVNQLK